jgi:hypothetical protein
MHIVFHPNQRAFHVGNPVRSPTNNMICANLVGNHCWFSARMRLTHLPASAAL